MAFQILLCHLQLPVLPYGFSLLPSVVENLTLRTNIPWPFCSWLWILSAPLGLQNLTPGTPRFTHFHASLRSFKSWALLIPGLIRYTIVATWSIWLETARPKWYITLEIKKTPFGVFFIFLISNFLFVPSCGFWAPLWGSKILRQELSDALWFMRRFAPLNHEPCLSQALSGIP